MRALPPKAKITALVCSGRRRLNVSHGTSKLRAGQSSWAAINTPTAMPTIPQMTVARANWRTTLSL